MWIIVFTKPCYFLITKVFDKQINILNVIFYIYIYKKKQQQTSKEKQTRDGLGT